MPSRTGGVILVIHDLDGQLLNALIDEAAMDLPGLLPSLHGLEALNPSTAPSTSFHQNVDD